MINTGNNLLLLSFYLSQETVYPQISTSTVNDYVKRSNVVSKGSISMMREEVALFFEVASIIQCGMEKESQNPERCLS